MADYEVLAPGGHAHLVSDVKSYADRAGGKGTTQLADGSVTRDKLADGVTDRIDAMHDRCDPLVGNYFFNELAEGAILTADDVYAAPPKGVEVFGKSTQTSYTGKNLLNPQHFGSRTQYTANEDGSITLTAGDSSAWTSFSPLPLSAGIYTLSWLKQRSGQVQIRTSSDDYTTNVAVAGTDGFKTFTLASDGGVKIKLGVSASSYPYTEYVQLESGSTATSYEPYVGGKAAPNPDYPQPIQSVDDLTLHVCGKNLFDPSHILEASGWTVSDGVYTGALSNLYEKYGRNRALYPIGGLSEDAATYTLSLDYSAPDSSKIFYLTFYYADGTTSGYANGCGTSRSYSFTTASGKNLVGIGFGYSSDQAISISNIQLELGSTATTYAPYIGQSVEIPLSNNKGRSLPDGTRDMLTLTYIGPSTRDGWGVFGASLKQNTMLTDMGELAWVNYYGNRIFYADVSGMANGASDALQAMCEIFTSWNTSTLAWFGNHAPANSIALLTDSARIAVMLTPETAYESASAFKTAMSGVYAHVPLATPITTDLGTVELPVNPVPDLTAWAEGGSAQPTMSMGYEQDINIVIARLEAAIADLATA